MASTNRDLFLLAVASLCIFHSVAQDAASSASATGKPNVAGTCGGVISGKAGGRIASPNFPNSNYPPEIKCEWEIIAPSDSVVVFSSSYMHLEPWDNDRCYDELLIYKTANLSDKPDLYCGNDTIYTQTSVGPKLIVRFTSDYSNQTSGFVLNWYVLNPSRMAPVINCDFEGPLGLCPGWTQSADDQFDWTITRGPTPSKNTGPSADHTTGTQAGRYAFIEASSKNAGVTAVLQTPQVTLNAGTDYCLDMWYHKYGTGNGNISVVLLFPAGNGRTLQSLTKETDNKWENVFVPLPPSDVPVRIGFEGIVGRNYRSDVAIDDIKLIPEACKKEEVINCTNEEFKCATGDTCVLEIYRCDSTPDCPDNSDEENCDEFVFENETTTAANLAEPVTTPQTDATGASDPKVCGSNQVYVVCAKSCVHTCYDGEIAPPCPALQCVARCACPPELPILYQGKCIEFKDCPAKPEEVQLTLKRTGPSKVQVTFKEVPNAASYRAMIYETANPSRSGLSNVNASSNRNAIVTVSFAELFPETEYSAQVFSINEGWEVASKIISLKTNATTTAMPSTTTQSGTVFSTTEMPAQSPLKVTQIEIMKAGPTSANVSFIGVANADSYRIKIFETARPSNQGEQTLAGAGTDKVNITMVFSGLSPETSYSVQIFTIGNNTEVASRVVTIATSVSTTAATSSTTTSASSTTESPSSTPTPTALTIATTRATSTAAAICESNLVYNMCASPCNHTCADGESPPACDRRCVSRCACPPETPILLQGRCVTFQDCPAPTLGKVENIHVGQATPTSATVSFKEIPMAKSYKIKIFETYNPPSFGEKQVDASSSRNANVSINFSGLVPERSYSVQIFSYANGKETSSRIIEINTPKTSMAPVITTTSAPGLKCSDTEIACDGGCLLLEFVCDDNNDCVDGADEKDCSNSTSCDPGQFSCSGKCIESSAVCDNVVDCDDGTDEIDCEETTTTPSTSTAAEVITTPTSALTQAGQSPTTLTTASTAAPATQRPTTPGNSCGSNLVFDTCASPCDHKCTDGEAPPPCSKRCVTRCTCPLAAPILHQGRCITFLTCPELEPVTTLTVPKVTDTSAVVSFGSVPSAGSYRVEFFQTFNPFDTISKTVPPGNGSRTEVLVSNLQPDTRYSVQVFSIRGEEEEASAFEHFKTETKSTTPPPATTTPPPTTTRTAPPTTTTATTTTTDPPISIASSSFVVDTTTTLPPVQITSAITRTPTETDSSVNAAGCLTDEFTCKNGQCMKGSFKCDGIPDCDDESDEENCTACLDGQFACVDKCIELTQLCDGVIDCADASDEQLCPETTTTEATTTQTTTTQPTTTNPPTTSQPTTTRATTTRTTTRRTTTPQATVPGCFPDEFTCKNGQCIQGSFKCDNIPDCDDGSDEANCTACQDGQLACVDKCIELTQLCDGVIDCADASDEQLCPETTTTEATTTQTTTTQPTTTNPPTTSQPTTTRRTTRRTTTPQATVSATPMCEQARNEFLRQLPTNPSLMSRFPDCTGPGLYKDVQCDRAARTCRCVVPETGTTVPGTLTPTSDGPPDCTALTECQKQFVAVSRNQFQNPSSSTGELPKCNDKGLFISKQCNKALGSCWCVIPETGDTISSTETNDGSQLDCSKLTKCQEQYLATGKFMAKNPTVQDGPSYPDCAADGLYSPKQCNGFTNVCWCVVKETGDAIPGKDTAPVDCTAFTKCQEQLIASSQAKAKNLTDPPSPNCADNGLYEAKQCSEGVCWCVGPSTGDIVPGTGRALETPLDCAEFAPTTEAPTTTTQTVTSTSTTEVVPETTTTSQTSTTAESTKSVETTEENFSTSNDILSETTTHRSTIPLAETSTETTTEAIAALSESSQDVTMSTSSTPSHSSTASSVPTTEVPSSTKTATSSLLTSPPTTKTPAAETPTTTSGTEGPRSVTFTTETPTTTELPSTTMVTTEPRTTNTRTESTTSVTFTTEIPTTKELPTTATVATEPPTTNTPTTTKTFASTPILTTQTLSTETETPSTTETTTTLILPLVSETETTTRFEPPITTTRTEAPTTKTISTIPPSTPPLPQTTTTESPSLSTETETSAKTDPPSTPPPPPQTTTTGSPALPTETATREPSLTPPPPQTTTTQSPPLPTETATIEPSLTPPQTTTTKSPPLPTETATLEPSSTPPPPPQTTTTESPPLPTETATTEPSSTPPQTTTTKSHPLPTETATIEPSSTPPLATTTTTMLATPTETSTTIEATTTVILPRITETATTAGTDSPPPPPDTKAPTAAKCAEERQNILDQLSTTPSLMSSMPSCAPDGTYQQEQCNRKTIMCRCVVPETGDTIPGTEKPQDGGPTADCSNLSECQKRFVGIAQFIHNNPGIADGPSFPECSADGRTFAPKQCNGMTGSCACVIPETGARIPGTDRENGSELDCSKLTPCQAKYKQTGQTIAANPTLMDGPLYPDCDQQGQYKTKQCNGFTGTCWCVLPASGKVIPATSNENGRSVNCSMAKLTKCQQRFVEIGKTIADNPSLADGPEFPSCSNADGLFDPTQCLGFSGVCNCVVPETGDVIPGTSSLRSQGATFNCSQLTKCQSEYKSTMEFAARNPGLMDGPIVRDCDPVSGLFLPRQCNGFTQVCWCVLPNSGDMIPGTQTEPDRGFALNCSALSKCQRLYFNVGMFVAANPDLAGGAVFPACGADGIFLARQCDGAGRCRCVDPDTGDTVPGSDAEPGKPLNCADVPPPLTVKCGENFTAISGTIESPKYPQMYLPEGECEYKILTSDPGQYIQLKVNDLTMPPPITNGVCSDAKLDFSWSNSRGFSSCDPSTIPPAPKFGSDLTIRLVPGTQAVKYSINYELKYCDVADQRYRPGSACDITCENPSPRCTFNVVERCMCPPDLPVLHNGRCIKSSGCPAALQSSEGSGVTDAAAFASAEPSTSTSQYSSTQRTTEPSLDSSISPSSDSSSRAPTGSTTNPSPSHRASGSTSSQPTGTTHMPTPDDATFGSPDLLLQSLSVENVTATNVCLNLRGNKNAEMYLIELYRSDKLDSPLGSFNVSQNKNKGILYVTCINKLPKDTDYTVVAWARKGFDTGMSRMLHFTTKMNQASNISSTESTGTLMSSSSTKATGVKTTAASNLDTESKSTNIPASLTDVPSSPTNTPVKTTGATVSSTNVQPSTTDGSIASTDASASPTNVPVTLTRKQAASTALPTQTTDQAKATTGTQMPTTDGQVPSNRPLVSSTSSTPSSQNTSPTESSAQLRETTVVSSFEQPSSMSTDPTMDGSGFSVDGSSTDAPVSMPDAPVSSTDAPMSSTDAPVSSSGAPVSSTDVPVSSTDAPVSLTDAPVSLTDAPASSTDAPMSSTDALVSSTDTPVSSSGVPVSSSVPLSTQKVDPTKGSAQDHTTSVVVSSEQPSSLSTDPVTDGSGFKADGPSTNAKMSSARTQASSTVAPVSSTGAPMSSSGAPVSSTDAPVSSTDAPVSSTEAPVSMPDAPVSSTDAPVSSTDAPVSMPDAPVSSTDAPVSSTDAPISSTDAPVSSTYAPVSSTDAPVSSTDAPMSMPDAPVSSTDAPMSSTDALISSTDAPVSSSGVSVSLTVPLSTQKVDPTKSSAQDHTTSVVVSSEQPSSLSTDPVTDGSGLEAGGPSTSAKMSSASTHASSTVAPVSSGSTQASSTDAPVLLTDAPAAATNATSLLTDTPVSSTNAPVVSSTGTPSSQTINSTKSSASLQETTVVVSSTETSSLSTAALTDGSGFNVDGSNNTPMSSTSDPVSLTDAPTPTTGVPAATTDASLSSTGGPMSSTSEPVSSTYASTPSTDVPAALTEASSTDASVSSTSDPNSAATEASVLSTAVRVSSTPASPTSVTVSSPSSQVPSTSSPVSSISTSVSPTSASLSSTDASLSSTSTPMSSTVVPELSTDAQGLSTDAEMSSTGTTVSLTGAPVLSTHASMSLTSTPVSSASETVSSTSTTLLSTDAPGSSTNTLLSSTNAPVSSTDAGLSSTSTSIPSTSVPESSTEGSSSDAPESSTDAEMSSIGTPLPSSGTPVPSSGTPVASSGTAVSSGGTPVASSGTPVPSSGTPVPSSGTPVASSGTSVPSSGTPVPSSGTPVASSGTPVASSGTPVPSSGTPVPSSGTPVPSSGTPVPSSGTPVPSSGTPVASSGTPVPSSGTPVASSDTSVPSSGTPMPSTGTPVPSSGTPVASSGTPVPSSGTPVASSGTSVPSSGTPVPSTGTPVPSSGTPVTSSGTPGPSSGTAVASSGTPVPSSGTPVASTSTSVPSTGTSVPSSGTPVASSGTSVPSSGTPVASTSTSVPSTGTSIPSSGTPVASSGTSVPSSGAPVPSTGTPVPSSGTPVASSGTPVASSGTPIPFSSTPVASSGPSVPSSDTPVPSTGTPVPSTGTPVASSGTTVPSTGTSVPSSGTPVASSGTPVPSSGTPVASSGKPVPSSGTPVASSGTPVPSSGTPVASSGTPVPSSGTPVASSGTPVQSSGTPVPSSGTPVASSGTPVPSSGTPVPSTGTPVRSSGSPVDSTASSIPLSSTTVAVNPTSVSEQTETTTVTTPISVTTFMVDSTPETLATTQVTSPSIDASVATHVSTTMQATQAETTPDANAAAHTRSSTTATQVVTVTTVAAGTTPETQPPTTVPPKPLQTEVMNIAPDTVCVKVKHESNVDAYLISIDQSSQPSDQGFSENFAEVKAMYPNTYKCFFDTIPDQKYVATVIPKEKGTTAGKPKDINFTTESNPPPTATPSSYKQTNETKKWQKDYNQWKNDTVNKWFKMASDYMNAFGSKLPGITPDPEQCPQPYKPTCNVTPRQFVDYNGCLFLICDSPKQGDFTPSDVANWEKEYATYTEYLLPQWQKLLASYSEAYSNNSP